MISLLIQLLVFAVVAGLIYWILTQLPLPAPWGRIVLVVFGVICLIIVLVYFLLPLLGAPPPLRY